MEYSDSTDASQHEVTLPVFESDEAKSEFYAECLKSVHNALGPGCHHHDSDLFEKYTRAIFAPSVENAPKRMKVNVENADAINQRYFKDKSSTQATLSPLATLRTFSTWYSIAYRSIEEPYNDRTTDTLDDQINPTALNATSLSSAQMLQSVYASLLDQHPTESLESVDTLDTTIVKDTLRRMTHGLESPVESSTAAGTLTCIHMLAELAGKKSLYTNAADKLESIARKKFPKIHHLYTVDAVIYSNVLESFGRLFKDTATSAEIKQGLQSLQMRSMDIHDVLQYEFFNQTAKNLRASKDHAAELQPYAFGILKDSLEREDDNQPTHVSDGEIQEILTLMDELEIERPKVIQSNGETPSDSEHAIDLAPMELDWKVLPPGELEETARGIVSDANKKTSATKEIDLTRLVVLESFRHMWGTENCYYSRGVRTKRPSVRDASGNEQPDEYIILVLQETDANGNVKAEHAIAESPIAGPNALYMYRDDATEHNLGWRKVMSVDKQQARLLGARPIKHINPGDHNPNDIMIDKISQLMTATPDDFHRIDFNGVTESGEVKIRKQKLGRHTLRIVS